VTVVDSNTLRFTLPPLAEGTYDVTVRQAGGAEATLRSGLQVLATIPASTRCEGVSVYFELDRANLSADSRRALDAQMTCYSRAGEIFRVEGHADERGTTDYNVALGQRRAEAVTRYLIGQGVSSRHLTTVSYGEERPTNVGHSEAAWAQNRRVEVRPGR
jgi:peptidoglycan-associated lipoprotein